MKRNRHIGFVADQEMFDKLHYIADYDGRTINGTLRYLLREYIKDFEAKNGEIKLEPKNNK